MNAQTAGKTLSLSDVPPVRDVRALIVELMGVFGIDVEAAADAADEASAYPAEGAWRWPPTIAGYEGLGCPPEAVGRAPGRPRRRPRRQGLGPRRRRP